MIIEFVHALRDKLDSEIDREVNSNGRGVAKDYDDYRFRVGIYTGLKRARDAVDMIFNKMMRDEGDD